MIGKLEGAAGLIILAALAVVGVWAYRKMPSAPDIAKMAADLVAGVTDVAARLNPLNPDNYASTVANAGVAAVTGDPNQTTGGWLFDVFNPRAGLAPGEVKNADGTISAAPVAGWVNGYDLNMGVPQYATTPGGAVTGIVKR